MSKPTKQPEHNPNRKDNESENGQRPKAEAYLKYSGMAIQMGIIILAGALAGQWLDGRFETERPYFTVLLSLLSIFAALYITLKDLFTGN